jgi:transcriptional regulator with XRE-family HTH domain
VTNAFPIRFPDQLRQHLRALRKARGLTQSRLGALVGVSQARIAEIEANPGLVNFDQLMKLLSVLGVTVSLQKDAASPARTLVNRTTAPPKPRSLPARPKTSGAPGAVKVAPSTPKTIFVVRPKKGSW